MADVDPHRLEAAGARFVAFFNELSHTFVEREELFVQIGLALLSREHVLMTGPPGTAKSGIASAVLRRVVDERTGLPSLFARQFTESTVQTDLIGPINFKTLMETGRTEHFTDEGMLGAVHAFLDEVFDGRDMLLRSTLNVLQERELKQGSKTTRGAIECALMTTNRYLAEVLEESRETLLAFVDRVAFVSFVPKGFASPLNLETVLRRQVGGIGVPRLTETLTIQDLDVLQAATEAVYVPDEVCEALATLLGTLDDELSAAERADPQFLATRYLSTRTAVRSGRLLRAACVYDRLFNNPDRELEVSHGDLGMLRLSILLAGPHGDALDALLKRESDPRERRQLAIIRTEREIFDRCLAKVSVKEPARRKHKPAAEARSTPPDIAKLANDQIVEVARGKISGGLSDEVRPLVEELAARAMRAGLLASSGLHDTVGSSISALLGIAEAIEKAPGETLPLARWTRGRALHLLDEAVTLVDNGGAFAQQLLSEPTLDEAAKVATERVEAVEKAVAHRARIRALGAEELDPAHSDLCWRTALGRAEDDVVAFLDAGFRNFAQGALTGTTEDLSAVLGRLAEPLAVLDGLGKRLAAVGAPAQVKARVVGPRIVPFVRAGFERVTRPDRQKIVAQVETIRAVLRTHGLDAALSPRDWLTEVARVLLRAKPTSKPEPPDTLDHEHYRKLRNIGHRVPCAYTLLETAMTVLPRDTLKAAANPDAAMATLREAARAVVPEVIAGVADMDISRLDVMVTFLERWFDSARFGEGEKVQRLVASGFYPVVFEEQALLRTALELRLVGDLFVERSADVEQLRTRIETLRDRAHGELEVALKQRSDAAWAAVLGT